MNKMGPGVEGSARTNRYFNLLARFIEKFSLRYDLRRPCLLCPTLPGMFASLVRELRTHVNRDEHLRALMHDFDSAYTALASYAALPGSQFTTFGAQPGRDFALLSLDAEARNRSGVTVGLGLESSVSHQSQSYYGIGRFGFTW